MAVTGIGGFFFRARDPEALSKWYATHLGVGAGDYGAWETRAGTSVFSPFKADTDYFSADKQWMLNLRVSDLDSLLEQLNAAGIDIETRPEWNDPATGQFARIHDPEGNAIELWEPPAAA